MDVEPLLSTYLHGKSARLGRPCSGNFELTPRCNFNCKMCYIHLSAAEQARRGRELTADQWLALGEDDCAEGLLFLLLTGGEPTLRPDFPEIYSGLKKMGLRVSINSNGYLLEGELREYLLQDPPNRINITLCGTSNETYEALCGVPAYDRVVANIRALREAGVDVKLNMSVTPENVGDLDRVAEQAKALGAYLQCASYLFPPIRINGTPDFPQRMNPREAGAVEARLIRRKRSPEELRQIRETLRVLPEPEEECANCRAGRSSFWLTWDGKLWPCGLLPTPAADVLTLGFREAWAQVRDQLRTVRFPAKCDHCRYRGICHICLAKCYTETLCFDQAPAYVCEMAEETVKALLGDERSTP